MTAAGTDPPDHVAAAEGARPERVSVRGAALTTEEIQLAWHHVPPASVTADGLFEIVQG